MRPDVTVILICHSEGALAVPALASMYGLVQYGCGAGLVIEARAVLDQADDLTRYVVRNNGRWLDAIQEVSFGDLGLSRNAGTHASSGEFLAFLDGDDLWGAEWLSRAYASANDGNAPSQAIWHPACLYFFSERDFDRRSASTTPDPGAEGHCMSHCSILDPDFDRDVLFLNNLWSANVFARRSVYLRYPYRRVNRNCGFGIEDWSWNIETLWDGLPHLVVPETVHLIRMKGQSSLGAQNVGEGLLPYFPLKARPLLGAARRNVRFCKSTGDRNASSESVEDDP